MEKYIQIIKKYRFYLVVVFVAVATLLINLNVRLYGDDWFYLRFSSVDFNYYVTRHIDHYFRANGRVIVHLLATLFLYLNIHIWQIFNSFMLCGIVFFGAKIITTRHSKMDLSYAYRSALILAISIAFFNVDLTRQSVYWLTGSFNYVYPIIMLLIYWFLINSDNKGIILPIMAFVSAATVEQVSLMSFGLTVLIIIERKFLLKEKPHRNLYISLVTSTIGMLTVLLAPSVFLRASIENAPVEGFIPLLIYNIKLQGTTFLFSNTMIPILFIAFSTAVGIILSNRDVAVTKWKHVDKTAVFFGISGLLCWLWQIISRNANTNYFNASRLQYLFYMFIGIGVLVLLLYAALVVYKAKLTGNNNIPLIALMLGVGSQAMLIISPVYGTRNLLTVIIMLAIYSAAILPVLNKTGISVILCIFLAFYYRPVLLPFAVLAVFLMMSENARRKTAAITLSYGVIILIACSVMLSVFKGYYLNAKVYDDNIEAAKEHLLSPAGGQLIQEKLPNDNYAWVMPYQNDYYIPYYNLFIGINQDEEINWK